MVDKKGLVVEAFRTDDHVSHKAFGLGYVTETSGDYVTVNFENLGLKKLMIKIAPLTVLSRPLHTPSMPAAKIGQPDAGQLRATVSVRKELISHVQSLHTRYDEKQHVAEVGVKENLHAKIKTHLEKLRSGAPLDNAPSAQPDLTHGEQAGLPDFITLAGVTFEGRQLNLARAHVGDAVRLMRRPQNAFDPNAVEVLAVNGESLGWVPKVQSSNLAAIIDAGTKIGGQISALVGNVEAGYNLGAKIVLSIESTKAKSKETQTMPSSTLTQDRRVSPASAASLAHLSSSYDEDDGNWESSLSDDECLEDESAEGLGVGDVSFEDADSEY